MTLAVLAFVAAAGVPKLLPPRGGVSLAPHASLGDNGLYYSYVAFGSNFPLAGGHGARGLYTVEAPALAIEAFHSLAELAVSSADGKQVVEIGWTVDVDVNGDLKPHLFAFHWVDGDPTCYNGCGFVSTSEARYPGMPLEGSDVPEEMAIEVRADGNWWLSYRGEDLGYFPGSAWQGRFTAAGYAQWFGEVASPGATTCTEMGNGKSGEEPGAATIQGATLIGLDGARLPARLEENLVSDPNGYHFGAATATGFAFGGPGLARFGCCQRTLCGGPAPCGTCVEGGSCETELQCQHLDTPDAPPSASQERGGGGGCQVAGDRSFGLFWIAAVFVRNRCRGRPRRRAPLLPRA